MKVNVVEMLEFFDEVLSLTDEEIGLYWLRCSRPDGISIVIVFSIYEEYVQIFVHSSPKITTASYSFQKCFEIRVLDMSKRCLEIICAPNHTRCFISFLGDTIVSYSA